MNAQRFVSIFGATTLAGLVAGCSSASKAGAIRVVRAEAPAATTGRVTPRLPEEDPRTAWIIAPPGSFVEENRATFAAAREAYWSYDLEKMAGLLQKLRENKGIKDDDFYYLLLTCYERSGRWAETLPMYERLGITESRHDWREFAERQARIIPEKEISFSADAPPVSFGLRNGDLMIADVTINGAPARVLLDTGANMTWWSRGFAELIGLRSLNQTVSLKDSNNHKRQNDLVLMRELKLGGLTVRDAPALAGRAWLFQLFTGVDGIIGWDVLQHAHLVIDFPARRLTLSRPSAPPPDEPILSGRIAPLFTVKSSEGVSLHLFYDSGASSNSVCVELYDNEGAIETMVAVHDFRRGGFPSLSMGLHSFRVDWPVRQKPFSFWMDGYRFETGGATLAKEMHVQDDFAYVDGVVGNLPFLRGKLTLCGVRRIAKFELTAPAP